MRRFFETFSFLPPLDDSAIAKQVDYIIRQGWIPALEFADAEHAYVKNDSTIRFGGGAPCNYYDNRYVNLLCYLNERVSSRLQVLSRVLDRVGWLRQLQQAFRLAFRVTCFYDASLL